MLGPMAATRSDADTPVRFERLHRSHDHACRGTAPSCMNGRDGSTAAVGKEHRDAVGDRDGNRP